MTEYIIFHVTEGATGSTITNDGKGAAWREFARVPAASNRAAVSKALADKKQEGTFVAVPTRSWQPVKVQVETALKFG